MTLNRKFSRTAKAFLARTDRSPTRRRTKVSVAAGSAVVLVGLALALSLNAHAAPAPTILYGTLDTQPSTAATEAAHGLDMAMFEFDWASYEPKQGTFSTSYMASQLSAL